MKKLMLLLLFLAPVYVAVAQTEAAAEVISPAEFQKKIQLEGVQLIDVRTSEEFEAGHLEGAVNIDFLAEDFLERTDSLARNRPLLIYCRSGNRSGKAAVQLRAQGFKNITDLQGGYKAWEELIQE